MGNKGPLTISSGMAPDWISTSFSEATVASQAAGGGMGTAHSAFPGRNGMSCRVNFENAGQRGV